MPIVLVIVRPVTLKPARCRQHTGRSVESRQRVPAAPERMMRQHLQPRAIEIATTIGPESLQKAAVGFVGDRHVMIVLSSTRRQLVPSENTSVGLLDEPPLLQIIKQRMCVAAGYVPPVRSDFVAEIS